MIVTSIEVVTNRVELLKRQSVRMQSSISAKIMVNEGLEVEITLRPDAAKKIIDICTAEAAYIITSQMLVAELTRKSRHDFGEWLITDPDAIKAVKEQTSIERLGELYTYHLVRTNLKNETAAPIH